MGVRMGRLSRAAMRRLFRGGSSPGTSLDPGIPGGVLTSNPGAVSYGRRMTWSATCQDLSGATWQAGREGAGKAAAKEGGLIRSAVTKRHMSGPPKESFDPLKKPPSPPVSPPSSSSSPSSSGAIPGNSFIFVASRRENIFGRTWRRAERVGKAIASIPLPPLVPLALGVGGAIPFVALAPPIASYAPLPEALRGREAEAQAAYAACILSFLGGPHWGMAMAAHGASPGHPVTNFTISSARYGWSVVPSLLAWPALLLPPVQKFSLLISSFGLTLGVDSGFSANKLVPKWYLPLRVLLTSVAIVSMTSSLSVSLTKPNSSGGVSKGNLTNPSREKN